MKSLIILPTYNEIENLERLVMAVLARGDFHLLVVDDSSSDGTGKLAERLKERYPDRIDVIHRPAKLGLGTAYLEGFRYALERDYDIIFEMDSDFSHDPSYLPKMTEAIAHADVVVGSRYVRGGGVQDWSWIRRLISRGGSLFTRVMLGIHLHDLTSGFVCYRRDVLASVDLNDLQANGYAFQIEMKWRSYLRGFNIVEIPIIFPDRKAGKSKMSARIVLEAFWLVWKLRLDHWRNSREKRILPV